MATRHHAANCHWATPTLFVDAPLWLAAEEYPWSCLRDTAPRTLQTTEPCTNCARWEERCSGECFAVAAGEKPQQ